MSSYHLDAHNLPAYYAKLQQYKPHEIIGFASSLYALARYIVDSKAEPIRTSLVVTTADTLMPYQRHILEQAFTGPLCNQYGCVEMAFFASECPAGNMHFHPEHGIAEVLECNGRTLQSGGSGELIATGLINAAMPLIRYRVGDALEFDPGDCSCKLAFPTIPNLEGRTDDLVLTPSGMPVGHFSPVFRADKAVKHAQVIQSETSALQVNIVPEAHYSETHERKLLKDLKARVGPDLHITITCVDSIPSEPNGKLRAVISHYKPKN